MRSSLAEVSGVSEVETDCSNKVCSFQADLDQVDLSQKLDELAADNDKMEGWSLVSMSALGAAAAEAAEEPVEQNADVEALEGETSDSEESSDA